MKPKISNQNIRRENENDDKKQNFLSNANNERIDAFIDLNPDSNLMDKITGSKRLQKKFIINESSDPPSDLYSSYPVNNSSHSHPPKSYSSKKIKRKKSKLSNDNQNRKSYMIDNVQVYFPFEAYPSQLAMMETIIRTLKKPKGAHALIESPTGSGKSLSILCATLGWMQSEQERLAKIKKENKEMESREVEALISNQKSCNSQGKNNSNLHSNSNYDFDYDNDSSNEIHFSNLESLIQKNGNSNENDNNKFKTCNDNKENDENESDENENLESEDQDQDLFKLPSIYITSRTHKQISQLVRELRKTGYNVNFTVLASRSNYCINEKIKKRAIDISDGCQEAIKQGNCGSFIKLKKNLSKDSSFITKLMNLDLEEMVSYGKKSHVCPYFSSREASNQVDIIFAPYNYIVEPSIRESLETSIKDSIVLIDEAHNIEDFCRSAATFEISLDELGNISRELQGITLSKSDDRNNGKDPILPEAHQSQEHFVSILIHWLSMKPDAPRHSQQFEKNTSVWSEMEIIQCLDSLGIIEATLEIWYRHLQEIIRQQGKTGGANGNAMTISNKSIINQSGIDKENYDNEMENSGKDQEKPSILSVGSSRRLESLYLTLKEILNIPSKNYQVFRMARVEESKLAPGIKNKGIKIKEITFGFWCLSSDIIFSPLAKSVKSIILTSGTLSPLETFESELNTVFSEKLEALHVIEKSQMWAGVIPTSSSGYQFMGKYENMESFQFQDELSISILAIVERIPFGVVCFLPSYSFLDKLLNRMKTNGTFASISKVKRIMTEPRGGGGSASGIGGGGGMNEEFEKFLRSCYQIVKDCKLKKLDSITGFLLFAVYRGKVSEGLDLADDIARAVIAIGIPYPSITDEKVKLKKEYNDKFKFNKKLLNGHQWYEIQAFRALNQALGRCIRHKNDWGAIVILESRFTIERNQKSLSRWIREGMQVFKTFDKSLESLDMFIGKMTRNEKEINNEFDFDYENESENYIKC